jgi:hypothetical protein
MSGYVVDAVHRSGTDSFARLTAAFWPRLVAHDKASGEDRASEPTVHALALAGG